MKIPKFKNLKEERKFWDSHESTNYLDDFEEANDVVFVFKKVQQSLGYIIQKHNSIKSRPQ